MRTTRELLHKLEVDCIADAPASTSQIKLSPRGKEVFDLFMPLSDISVRNAKPQQKPAKLFDGGGLFLFIAPTGGKMWRLKYRFQGKEKLLALGVYPDVGLKEARKRRDEAREQLAMGCIQKARHQSVRRAWGKV